MNSILISIIIPVYKAEKYLHNCVDSVIAQTYNNWEAILVDDGSPDGSGAICDEYAEKDSRIRVIHKKNEGASSARNAALDIMKGNYVSFLDSDDFWHPSYLSRLIKYVDLEKADIVQCGFVRGEGIVFPSLNQQESYKIYDNHSIFISEVAKIIMWGKLYNAELFKGVRMPEGIIHEDDWFTWKLYYAAKTIVVTNASLYYYTFNSESVMGTNKRKPNLIYFGAYEERINFFHIRGEKDLEDISHLQFCKSLLLLYSNEMLSDEQRTMILTRFKKSWKILKHSVILSSKLKIIFGLFNFYPFIIARFIRISR